MGAPGVTPNAAIVDDSDDDDISLTSTISDDPDQEWEVEKILAEHDGKCLVEWSGFPLAEATLEPRENLPDSVLDTWEETKQRITEGLEEPFRITTWVKAKREFDQREQDEHNLRHRRRNRKRMKLGLPLKKSISDDGSDDSESVEEADEAEEYEPWEDTPPRPKASDETKQTVSKETGRSAQPIQVPKQRSRESSETATSAEKKGEQSPRKRSSTDTGYKGTARPVDSLRQKTAAAETSADALQPTAASASASTTSPPKAAAASTSTTSQSKTAHSSTGIASQAKAALASKSTTASQPKSTAIAKGVSASQSKFAAVSSGSQANQEGRPPQANPARPGPAQAPKPPKAALGVSKATSSVPGLSQADVASLVRPKAKKTGKTAVGNVFVSGKVVKKRKTFADVLFDSTQEPRAFNYKRQERLAELKARELADKAPSLESFDKAALFPLGQARDVEPVQKQKPSLLITANIEKPLSRSEDGSASRRGNSAASELTSSARSTGASPVTMPSRSSLKKKSTNTTVDDADGEPPRKRRVRWLLEEDGEMNDEKDGVPPLVMSPQTIMSPQSAMSPQAYFTADQGTQRVKRRVKFGSDDAPFDVLFSGVTRDGTQAWLSTFIEDELVLDLSLKCAAVDFATQRMSLMRAILSSGTLLPLDNGDGGGRLDVVAEKLQAGAFGLYFGRPDFSVLVYPGKCDEWQTALGLGTPSTSATEGLQYVIFSGTAIAAVRQDVEEAGGGDQAVANHNFIEAALGHLKYDDLLPSAARMQSEVGFYLLFPEKARALQLVLLHWLKDHGKDKVVVFSSFKRGSWAHLVDLRSSRPWVMLIHESVVHMTRRFPQFAQLLRVSQSEFSFWMISESLHARPLYKALAFDKRLEAGRIWGQRLFPRGAIILLPPSLVVSDPDNAYKLLRWFIGIHEPQASPHWRLVVPSDFVSFARSVAAQKSGRTDVRWKISEVADGMLRRWESETDARDNMSCPLVLADPIIDPHDEQSLVNWFASLTITHLNRFRRFYILWSTETKQSDFSLEIPIPRFIKGTINDPDITPTLRIYDAPRSSEPPRPPRSQGPPEAVMTAPEKVTRSRVTQFPSRRFSSDSGPALARWLKDVESRLPRNGIVRLFAFPVAYLDFRMSDHFENSTNPQFRRYLDWLNYTYDFTPKYNTYLGFFYTIPDRFAPKSLDMGNLSLSHPWVVALRPINPHIKPYTKLEMLIWDPGAPKRCPGMQMQLPMSSLLYMQRQLIRLVAEKAKEKFKLELENVWLGGWAPTEAVSLPSESGHPLDVASSFLEDAVDNVRGWLPAHFGRLESRGWRRVRVDLSEVDRTAEDAEGTHELPPAPLQGMSAAVGNTGSSMQIDAPSPRSGPAGTAVPSVASLSPVNVEEADPALLRDEQHNYDPYSDSDSDLDPLERRHVFHAPPNPLRLPNAPPSSVCRNRLFDHANAARKFLRRRLQQPQQQHQQQQGGQEPHIHDQDAAAATAIAGGAANEASPTTATTPRANATDGATMIYTWLPTRSWHAPQFHDGRGFEHIFASECRTIFRECQVGLPSQQHGGVPGVGGKF